MVHTPVDPAVRLTQTHFIIQPDPEHTSKASTELLITDGGGVRWSQTTCPGPTTPGAEGGCRWDVSTYLCLYVCVYLIVSRVDAEFSLLIILSCAWGTSTYLVATWASDSGAALQPLAQQRNSAAHSSEIPASQQRQRQRREREALFSFSHWVSSKSKNSQSQRRRGMWGQRTWRKITSHLQFKLFPTTKHSATTALLEYSVYLHSFKWVTELYDCTWTFHLFKRPSLYWRVLLLTASRHSVSLMNRPWASFIIC